MEWLYYKLNADHTVSACTPVQAEVSLRRHDSRRVAEDVWDEKRVSTVFLVIDHQYGSGPPLLFETMVFHTGEQDNPHEDHYCERYSTWEEALVGHQEVVRKLKAGEDL